MSFHSSTKPRLERLLTSSRVILQTVPTKTAAYARWQNPLISVASLIAGFVLCVGHHIFYWYLDGRLVSIQPYIIREWAVSLGTCFAFLAHSALSISIGITFWQLFWSTLHKKSLKLSTIDSLADSWRSVTKLLDFRVIKASPLLVLMAATAIVFVPIAVMFPPGTLRTKIDYQDAIFDDQVIQTPAWERTQAFARFSTSDGHYFGPSRNVVRASCATACQMDLPTLPKIHGVPNATYELKMFTPTVQCRETSSDLLTNFSSLFNCTEGPYGTCGNKQNVYTYLAWAPTCNATICAANIHTNVPFNGSLPQYIRNVGSPGYGPAQLYISTLHGNAATNWLDLDNWRTLNCSLFNASQVANFTFDNDYSHAYFDSSQMQLLNPVILSDGDRIGNNTAVEQSYLALMDALGGILTGTVYWNHDFAEWLVRDTVILDSKLAQTAEITPWSSLTDDMSQWNVPRYVDNGLSLGSMIEELFHNITLSLFAHGDFTKPITVHQVHAKWHSTHFDYGPAHLIISYGIAVLLTTIITVIGYVSVVKEGKSYSNRLSTVIRTMQNEDLNAVMGEQHRGGEDPLPKHLAKTKVQISRPRTIAFTIVEDCVPRSSETGSSASGSNLVRHDR